jgi:hypothetical protein
MVSHNNGKVEYYQQFIPDPVCAVLFTDKVVIVTSNGVVIERELYVPIEDLRTGDKNVIERGQKYWDDLHPGSEDKA